jgi:hypothetical protein
MLAETNLLSSAPLPRSLARTRRDVAVLDLQKTPSQVRRRRAALPKVLGPWREVPWLPEASDLGPRCRSKRAHEEPELWGLSATAGAL